ncbi:MAG: hypothetical protein M1834_002629 [Cirrosporium novae-zelandiae]|nr:MAG: hypothetical protein M1834_002629 [Cirrosporium novae-zelandiae]
MSSNWPLPSHPQDGYPNDISLSLVDNIDDASHQSSTEMGERKDNNNTSSSSFVDAYNIPTTTEPPQQQPSWSHRPRQLGKFSITRIAILLFDITLTLSPFFFIAREDGQSAPSSRGIAITRITRFIPSAFPIVFAALMGRFFRSIGLYKAERGVKLGVLEHLIGCQSLFSALERQIMLRKFTFLGFIILVPWILSPLGGQAGLRLISTVPESSGFNTSLRYLSPVNNNYSVLIGGSPGALLVGGTQAIPLFLLSLMSPDKTLESPMDVWGNIKIPRIDSLMLQDTANTGNPWREVDPDNVTYASYIGIPVAGIPSVGNSSFTIESFHFNVNCFGNEKASGLDFIRQNYSLLLHKDSLAQSNSTVYQRLYNISYGDGSYYPSTFFLDTTGTMSLHDRLTSFAQATSPKSLVFGSVATQSFAIDFNWTLASDITMTFGNCSIGKANVESKVRCQNHNCQVTAMRYADHHSDPPSYLSTIDSTGNVATLSQYLSIVSNRISLEASPILSTSIERWLYSAGINVNSYNEFFVNLYDLAPEVLATRLTLVLNTLWQSSFATEFLGGDIPQDLTYYDGLTYNASNGGGAYFNPTPASVTTSTGDIYVCSWPWFATLLVISIILQICSVLSLVFKYYTLSPDILGYVSSSLRDNPYALLPGRGGEGREGREGEWGSAMDGFERTRVVGDVVVMVGDVRGREQVGHVAVATVGGKTGGGDTGVIALRKDRFYD